MQIAVGRRRKAENGWHGRLVPVQTLRSFPRKRESRTGSQLSRGRTVYYVSPLMTTFLHSQADLDAALAQLIQHDPRLKPVAETAGPFALRRREAGFAGLCSIVCGQQLSTASAAAIRERLFAAFDPFHHDTVRKARTDKLKRLGLSAPKIKAIREIGKALARKHIDLERVGDMDADQAH